MHIMQRIQCNIFNTVMVESIYYTKQVSQCLDSSFIKIFVRARAKIVKTRYVRAST